MRWLQDAADFIEAASRAQSLDDLHDCLTRALEPMGVPFFGCFATIASGENASLQTVPIFSLPDEGWIENYQTKRHFNHDAVVHEAILRPDAFTFEEIEQRDLSKTARSLFGIMRDAFPIRDAYMVPVHGANGYAGLFGLYSTEAVIPHEKRSALRVMALYALERARHLHLAEAQFVSAAPCPLTPRQREMLAFAAQGKSDWDIGQIVGIAASTVNEHIEKAKSALRVKTRAQAIAIAVYQGWIKL